MLLLIALLGLLRISDHTTPAYDRHPRPTVKVYDPYGHLEWQESRDRFIGEKSNELRRSQDG